MIILAFLQNQWFKNPAAAKALFERYPHRRSELIARFLFMGGLSGSRLQSALGKELCDKIIWENASPEIGAVSGSRFKADHAHMKRVIENYSPDIIIGFGRIASDALISMDEEGYFDARSGDSINSLNDSVISDDDEAMGDTLVNPPTGSVNLFGKYPKDSGEPKSKPELMACPHPADRRNPVPDIITLKKAVENSLAAAANRVC